MVEGQSPDGDRPPEWDQIVEQHAKRVFQMAVRISEVFRTRKTCRRTFSWKRSACDRPTACEPGRDFLVRLATLRSLDLLRRRRSTSQLRPDDKISTQGPFEAAAANELAAQLRAAIADLPDQQAAVFVLFHFEHLSRAGNRRQFGRFRSGRSTALYKARQHLLAELAAVKQ